MNWDFVRREWGAVTFVLTVVVGMIVVPIALYFANQGPGALAVPITTIVSSARSSSAQTASPSPASSVRSPSPGASASPSHSP